MAGVDPVKFENDGYVKVDPDSDMPGALLEDDEGYEDTGELNMSNTSRYWLTRIPREMWETIEQMNDEEDTTLGKVQSWKNPQTGEERLKVVLNQEFAEKHLLPKDYDLSITRLVPESIYVFSEKDKPGYRSKYLSSRQKRGTPSLAQNGRPGEGYSVQKRSQFRSIPKHTSLAGAPNHEASCLPIENDFSNRIAMRRSQREAENKRDIRFLTGDPRMHHDALRNQAYFENFIKTAPSSAQQRKKKGQDNKAVRIPQDQLLDKLYACFKQYKYWPMRALRQATKQPEAYLKETLGLIAVLIRSGEFAMNWKLKPEVEMERYQGMNVKEEAAPEIKGENVETGESEFDDEDEGLEMEDVV